MLRFAIVVVLAGCWSAHEPARWHRTTPEVLPRGAWLAAALDLTADSPAQRAKERDARDHPDSVRTATGCQFPGGHFAIAVYARSEVAFVGRGTFDAPALLGCIADSARGNGSEVATRALAGRDVLAIRSKTGDAYMLATDHGLLVGATSSSLMQRVLADDTGSVLDDPALGPLIASARRGGAELWLAALVPRDSTAIADVLAAIDVRSPARIVSVVGAIRFTSPARVELVIAVEGTDAARSLAAALTRRRATLRGLVDPGLAPLLDAIAITAAGATVRITGAPAHLDWIALLRGALATVPRLAH